MKAEILTVGTEILMGQIVNTNAQYISQRLAELGVEQYRQFTVGDNHDRLAEAIRESLSHSDIVIMTGGLGPTGDDISKETAAEVMGYELVCDDYSLEQMKKRFEGMHHNMTPNNIKQAMFPKESIILKNPNGTAPGCIMERDGKTIILLPGPPKEMIPMFNNEVTPYLEARSGFILYSRMVRIFGSGESSVEYAIRDLMDSMDNPTIAPYALTGEVTLRVTAKCADEAEGKALVEPVLDKLHDILGDVIYSTNGESLNVVCAQLLKKSKKTLALAESCTGGMLSSMLVEIPGSSAFLLESAVTYSNSAKESRLGVPGETLSRFGAVSEQTARAMAEGIRHTSGADIGISVTGIAGPDGGTDEKPVGLVYIGFASDDGTDIKKLELFGNRERVRYGACLNALSLLRRYLLK